LRNVIANVYFQKGDCWLSTLVIYTVCNALLVA